MTGICDGGSCCLEHTEMDSVCTRICSHNSSNTGWMWLVYAGAGGWNHLCVVENSIGVWGLGARWELFYGWAWVVNVGCCLSRCACPCAVFFLHVGLDQYELHEPQRGVWSDVCMPAYVGFRYMCFLCGPAAWRAPGAVLVCVLWDAGWSRVCTG